MRRAMMARVLTLALSCGALGGGAAATSWEGAAEGAASCARRLATSVGAEPGGKAVRCSDRWPTADGALRVRYVDGSDSRASDRNDGSEAAPWKTIGHAAREARPGDVVYVMAGLYEPFEIKVSGSEENHIAFVAHPGHEREVIIDGQGTSVRGLIEARGRSFVTITGFQLRNAPTDGIFVEGSPEGARGVEILGNRVENTGNAGIYVAGLIMGQTPGINEYRLFDVLIEGNEVTRTNVDGGRNEAISLGGGVDGFVIRHNWVHNSNQFGIDAKMGAINGEISGNLIHDIEKHGIYLDSNSRTVAHVRIFGNEVFGNRNGIVLARESDRTPVRPQLFDIAIHDNIVRDHESYGIMAYRHQWDNGTGEFADVRIYCNLIEGSGRDGIHLKDIGNVAKDFVVAGNTLLGNGNDILNQIGALVSSDLRGCVGSRRL